MADSFESVKQRTMAAAGRGEKDRSAMLRRLDPRPRKALELFRKSDTITSHQVGLLFGISNRAARNLLLAWVEVKFLVVVDPAKKSRKYGLGSEFSPIVR